MNLLEFVQLIKPNYVPDWYHEVICEHLDSGRDVLVSTPPGAGKTELVSILLPTHALCHNPKQHVISLSNSDSLARLASSNILRNLQSPDVQERWPLQFDKQAETQFTIAGGDGRPSVHATGISGQVTGQRADLLIFDDLVKSQSEAYSETIREKIWANFSSCAETRLLPGGRIVGIGTRWHLDDPIGRLIRRAREDRRARQFIYISLAATNDSGEESFVLDTRTGKKQFFPKYRSLASKPDQPYSFSRAQLEGKKADLGPGRFSALYQQSPLTAEDQLFPPECWKSVDTVDTESLSLIVTAWDCASKTSAKNDYSANVVIGRTPRGWVVLDVWKGRVAFAELKQIAVQRYASLWQTYRQPPLLVIEDANAGTQLLQIIEYEFPEMPKIAAKPVHAKIVRAEGVTPMTRGGLVALPKDAEWRDGFISELANFPVGEHDDVVDAFCHGMKAFVGAGDFRKPELTALPGRAFVDTADMEFQDMLRSPLDEADNFRGEEWMGDATRMALNRNRGSW